MPRASKRRPARRKTPLTYENDIHVDDDHRSELGPSLAGPSLPPELFRNIVEEVALSIHDEKTRNGTLYNLLLTSQGFRAEAERVLYRNITFVSIHIKLESSATHFGLAPLNTYNRYGLKI